MAAAPLHALADRLPSFRLPRGTVRLRLTVLYGALFLVGGGAVLAITYLLMRHALSGGFSAYEGSGTVLGTAGTGIGQPPSGTQTSPAPGDLPLTEAQTQVLTERLQRLATAQRAHELHQLLTAGGIALGVMAVVAVGLGYLMAGRVLRPLRTITETTRHISERNLQQRLALRGPSDELTTLGDTIDALLARLEDAFTAQRRFVANASHELRTPLTMMRTAIDVATGKPGPPRPEVQALAARLRLGLDRADQLVESFLTLAQAEHETAEHETGGHETEVSVDRVALEQIVATVIADRRSAIAAAGLTLDSRHHDGADDAHRTFVRGSVPLLTHLVENLVDNAIRHNLPGGWITVTMAAEPGTAVVTVENSGRVLEQGDVDQLTQPFRRSARDRTGTTGSGLGLSIVAAIVTRHRGSLDLQARPDGGLRVTVRLPTTEPATDAEPVHLAGSMT